MPCAPLILHATAAPLNRTHLTSPCSLVVLWHGTRSALVLRATLQTIPVFAVSVFVLADRTACRSPAARTRPFCCSQQELEKHSRSMPPEVYLSEGAAPSWTSVAILGVALEGGARSSPGGSGSEQANPSPPQPCWPMAFGIVVVRTETGWPTSRRLQLQFQQQWQCPTTGAP
ncbi:hypothetical protein BC828DRAFT_235470 [Blastocladiella britannica]|nr:hypothetical protein BC828DRAFT_235470 [Blastocladiella britannica]